MICLVAKKVEEKESLQLFYIHFKRMDNKDFKIFALFLVPEFSVK